MAAARTLVTRPGPPAERGRHHRYETVPDPRYVQDLARKRWELSTESGHPGAGRSVPHLSVLHNEANTESTRGSSTTASLVRRRSTAKTDPAVDSRVKAPRDGDSHPGPRTPET